MLKNLSIRAKISFAFVLIAVVTLGAGSVSYWKTSAAQADIIDGIAANKAKQSVMALKKAVTQQAGHLRSFVLTGDRADLEAFKETTATVETLSAAVAAASPNAEIASAFSAAMQNWRAWRAEHTAKVVNLMRRPETTDLARLEEATGPGVQELAQFQSQIIAVEARIFQLTADAAARQTSGISEAQLAVLIGAGVVVALTVWLGVITAQLMTKIGRTLAAIEAGRVETSDADMARRDEVGALARAAATFRDKLAAVEHAEDERIRVEQEAVEARAATLDRLRSAFGAVVDGAIEGDFSKRVDATFDDAALNELASGVNELLNSVEQGVTATKDVAQSLAAGDLTGRMTGDFKGAFADLRDSLNASIETLEELVSEIIAGVDQTKTSSAAIKQSADDLAARSESQASSLEETAATMEEMTANIRSNAESADNARKVAEDATDRARKGGDIVVNTMSAMDKVEESATKISDIISVIDGIAFQTNLLALNAAVEAARAGDAGKGFAVVASEVRDLAQRSAGAAKDISTLIAESTGNVTTGVELVKRTGEALTEIVSAVETVASSVSDISTANREQSSGVDEISNAVSHLDQLTQQNAALSEESARSARDLTANADWLADKTRRFKTTRRGGDDLEAMRRDAAADAAAGDAHRGKADAPAAAAAAGGWADFAEF